MKGILLKIVKLLNYVFDIFKNIYKNHKVYTILIGIIVFLFLLVVSLTNKANRLKIERDTYKNNQTTLLEQTKQYKTKDSLNAASVYELQLSLSAYKAYHKDDLAKINNLEIKNRNLENIITVNGKIKVPIDIPVKDSIVYVDKIISDTVKTIKASNEWYSIDGVVDKSFKGTIGFNEKLGIVVSIRYKRFLGFLWKTNKVKDKKCDVVNFNPYGTITKIEYITIK